MASQVVDTSSVQELMREVLERTSPSELRSIAAELSAKSARARVLIQQPAADSEGGLQALGALIRSSFLTRRRASTILAQLGAGAVGRAIEELVDESNALDARVERFESFLSKLPDPPLDLCWELLHLVHPERYWLWTQWIWDPRAETGALRLVVEDDVDLFGATRLDTYLLVGRAQAFVGETAASAGLPVVGDGPFGIDVFLAAVYCVYMYVVLRLRMTQEFNRVVPQLPELARRLLGTYRSEV